MNTQKELSLELRELLAECISMPDELLVKKTERLKEKLNCYDWSDDLRPTAHCTSASTS